ncbi:uncharacterized protein LOC129940659 [Eupeodes corollae]|uniref:uncharacterized protein LOC129940659 n=1 Tax=Eupeodes corollae TaxID=290404 RepID=UPI002490B76C|nr:uncharacterized protein LOC129940659 [Eupeodes corollae]
MSNTTSKKTPSVFHKSFSILYTRFDVVCKRQTTLNAVILHSVRRKDTTATKKTLICLVQKFDPDIEMEGRKTLKLTNQNQFETLVELMGRNVELARGFLKGIQKTDVKKEWAAIAEQLNSKGPPVRDGDGWQKVWTDMKHNVKKKCYTMRKN